MLLHSGNVYPSVPLAYSVQMKESHEIMRTLLNFLDYDKYKWKICRDLKVLELLVGLQQGYTKYCCFLCEWDSHNKKHNHVPLRHSFTSGKMNISFEAFVNRQGVYLLPLHIKLGLMKIFVKALDRAGQAFAYLRDKFPKFSEAKVKEGIFIGPQM